MRLAGRPRPRNLFSAFARDERGAIAIIVGLVIIVVAIGACFAIDFARASAARQDLQDALDAATLRAARMTGVKDREVLKSAAEFLSANLESDRDMIQPAGAWQIGKDSVTGFATAKVEPYFIGLPMGAPFKLRVKTVVRRAYNATELALVLDTTGSMAGTKISTLKTAATSLVTTLTAQKDADVKIAVIPFGQYVNIGVARRSEPWADVPADYSQRVTPPCTTITQRTTCQTERYACTRYNDGVPYQTTCTRSINCKTTPIDPPQKNCPAPYTNNYRFQGCIGSPAYPKNVRDDDPSRRYPGFLNLSCGSELTPLTANPGQMKSAISTLQASGETYIPAGLAWGFNALSRANPLKEAAAYDREGPNLKPRKVLVLMTDGQNTKLMNASNGRHDVSPASGQRAKQADDYTAELCRNIKAEKIELFAVAFDVDDATTKSMLRKCATDSKHYFDAQDSTALLKAFNEIAEALQNLYIAR
jgi:Flp pilus assembly protein TadG